MPLQTVRLLFFFPLCSCFSLLLCCFPAHSRSLCSYSLGCLVCCCLKPYWDTSENGCKRAEFIVDPVFLGGNLVFAVLPHYPSEYCQTHIWVISSYCIFIRSNRRGWKCLHHEPAITSHKEGLAAVFPEEGVLLWRRGTIYSECTI